MAVEIELRLDDGSIVQDLARLQDAAEQAFQEFVIGAAKSDAPISGVEAALEKLLAATQGVEAAVRETGDQLENGFNKAKKAGESSGSVIDKAYNAVSLTLAAAVTAIGTVVGGIAALTQHVTQGAVETANYATALGISAEQLNVFELAARRAGGDVDGLREGIRTAQEGISEFVNLGSGPAAEALQVLGVSLTDTQGRTRDIAQAFPELVTALGQVSNDADRTRLAIQLFGEEDSRVIVQLASNPAAFAQAAEAAQRYGTTLSGDLVGQSRTFQTGLVDLQTALGGLATEIVSALLPTLNEIIPRFTEWVAGLRESEAVQQTLIPALQTVVGALGQFEIGVSAVQAVWTALNVSFNIVLGGILAGIEVILSGLRGLISGAEQAARFLGLTGVADGLASARDAVAGVRDEVGVLATAAFETANEWQQSLNEVQEEFGKTTQAVQTTAQATEQGGVRVQASTDATIKKIEELQGAHQKTGTAAVQGANTASQAYANLGVQTTAALRRTADAGIRNFEAIRGTGTESAERLRAIFVDQVLPKITMAYQTFSQRIAVINKGIADDGTRRILTLQAAYEQLGLQAPEALRRLARDAIAAFEVIVRTGERSLADLRRIYEDTVVKPFQEAFNKLPPAADRAIAIIRSSTQEGLAGVQQETERTYERVNGVYTNSANVGKEQIASVGQQTAVVLQGVQQTTAGTYAAVNQTYQESAETAIDAAERIEDTQDAINDRLPAATQRAYAIVNGVYTESARVGKAAAEDYGSTFARVQAASRDNAQAAGDGIAASFEGYTAIAQTALKNTADAAVREFQRSFDSGRFTTEGLAQLWADELVPTIQDAYGRIPPHLQAIHDRMTAIVASGLQQQEALTGQSVIAQQAQYARLIPSVSSTFDSLGRIIGDRLQDVVNRAGDTVQSLGESVRSVTNIIRNGLQSITETVPFGGTVEDLTDQIGQAMREIDNIRNSIGSGTPTDFIQFQVKQLTELLNELIKRRQELLEQGQGSDFLRNLFGFPPAGQDPGIGGAGTGSGGGRPAQNTSSTSSSVAGTSEATQRRLEELLRASGFSEASQAIREFIRLQESFGGGVEGQRLAGALRPELLDLLRFLTPPQQAVLPPTVTTQGPENPFLPPAPPQFTGGGGGGGGGGGSGFDGGPLDPNLDPLGLGAGGNSRSSGGARGSFTPNLDPLGLGAGQSSNAAGRSIGGAVTFAAGSIMINTQARDANALAVDLAPALNQLIRLGVLKT